MFNQISWADYISTVIAVTLLYYAVVAIHYYRHEIAYYFSYKEKLPSGHLGSSTIETEMTQQEQSA